MTALAAIAVAERRDPPSAARAVDGRGTNGAVPRAASPGRASRVLLVGPCPPPHGGISVHVAMARELLTGAGIDCRVLDVAAPRARPMRARRAVGPLAADIRRRSGEGWATHLHTNGHNRGSWLLALACGLAARRAPLRVLTLHSGLAPAWLEGRASARWLARLTLAAYDRVVCVNTEIHAAVTALGVPRSRLATAPAYLGVGRRLDAVPADLRDFLSTHAPVIVATSCFRPEYGLDLLLAALRRLAVAHPQLGCLLLGSGEGEARLRRELDASNLGERVRATGDVPHELALELMARADVFARPTYADGDSLSVREALALGLPVVASDASPRPAGVTLCRRGDPEALASALAAVLDRRLGPPAADGATPLPELLALYELAPRRGSA